MTLFLRFGLAPCFINNLAIFIRTSSHAKCLLKLNKKSEF